MRGTHASELVKARKAGNFVLVSREEVDYVDVSPTQRRFSRRIARAVP